MENDCLTIFDVENGILFGEILERQRDLESDEWKYLIGGCSLEDENIVIAAKLSDTGKLVIITVYREVSEEYEN